MANNSRIPPRGPMSHGAPYNSTARQNPTVNSKSDRRYGKNETHGEQPARTRGGARPSVGISHETPHGTPRSEKVGHATDGSGRFHRPTYPLASHRATGEGDHRGPSTAGAKGMADKAK